MRLGLIFFLIFFSIYSKEVIHKVKKGEYLYKIALKYFSETEYLYIEDFIDEIKKTNNIKKYVRVNQKLRIILSDKKLKTERISPPDRVMALYYPVSSVSYRNFLDKVRKYKKVGINSVVIDIKNMTGEITVPFNNPLKKEIKKRHWSSLGSLNKLLYYLHKENIYTIARVVCFHDEIMASSKKEYRVFSHNKEWVNPANKEVRNYLLNLIDTLLKYPIDELQLDYVRFPASRKSLKGVLKKEVIVDFLKEVHKKTQKAGIKLGLDVFGIALWQRKVDEDSIGQNLRAMADYSDVISPMIYPSHFSKPFNGIENPGETPDLIIKKSFERSEKIFKDKDIEVRPYLQAFSMGTSNYGKNYILKQLREIKNHGFIFWNARGKYKAVYDALYYLKKKKQKEAVKEGEKEILNIIENSK